jgi:hypothetical protein
MGGVAIVNGEPFFTVRYVSDDMLSDIDTRIVGLTEDPNDPSAKSLLFQRSLSEPTAEDRQFGMDTYAISTEQGVSEYAPLWSYELTDATLTLNFTEEGADLLGIPPSVILRLDLNSDALATLRSGLSEVIGD